MSKLVMCLDTHELAWAAGFFDGEGSVLWRGRKRKELCMSIAQSDLSPLERFHKAIGLLGSLRGPYHHRAAHHKPYWIVSTNGFENTQAVLALLWNWLSEPKRRQSHGALTQAAPYYRARFLSGKGRAVLSMDQARALRAEHSAAKVGRQRVPQGWVEDAMKRYGVRRGTIIEICGGRTYVEITDRN